MINLNELIVFLSLALQTKNKICFSNLNPPKTYEYYDSICTKNGININHHCPIKSRKVIF